MAWRIRDETVGVRYSIVLSMINSAKVYVVVIDSLNFILILNKEMTISNLCLISCVKPGN